ncbi:MAG: hypothetical protein KBT82_04295 [Marinobacter sp.]|uniref:hypothetical protein n=1 Tax=Marinobacter sp. TaxID=50741 RepID=UPI001B6E571D|nr:hypothetical protein [Marinobacter sp.]MBQ0747678.1 hypothetical protein [Marinobacter sp.]MBQ0813391.1 hypothetical protein [Marinobacter sp.]
MLDFCAGQVKPLANPINYIRSPALNHKDFASLLVKHGFTPQTYDFDSTMLGFQHDIFNALIHNDSVFSEQSLIRAQPDCPDALLRCELIAESGDLASAVQHFYARWFAELRYENPMLELLNLEMREDVASIHVLTITKANAMTFVFNIQRGG